MICGIKAVALMEATNVIWCGVDPGPHDSDGSTVMARRDQARMQHNLWFLYLFKYINYIILTEQRCCLGPSEAKELLMSVIYL